MTMLIQALAHMRKNDLAWLADIVESMLGGDPWQEGEYARKILEAYWQQIPAL